MTKISGELEYRIGYDVEHDLFHVQNVFNDEYITPTFVEYVQKLEKENAELKGLRCCENCKNINLQLYWRESEEIDKRRQFVCGTCGNRKNWKYLGKTVGITETQQLNKAREIIKTLADDLSMYSGNYQKELLEAEQFLTVEEK